MVWTDVKIKGDNWDEADYNSLVGALGGGNPAQGVSYVLYKIDTDFVARNGEDGTIDFSGTDESTVIQAAADALTDGGKLFIKRLSTPYLCDVPIGISSNTIVDSDYAVLAGNWAVDYSPVALGLPTNFPPILYNKNYGDAYGNDEQITIQNLVLQGEDGMIGIEQGGSIAMRFRGCDDLTIRNMLIDNETVIWGTVSEHQKMPQGGLAIDRYCRRVNISNFILRGGWMGIYFSDPFWAHDDDYPAVAYGSNLNVNLTNFHIDLYGLSDAFLIIHVKNLQISNGYAEVNRDLVFDIQHSENIQVDNVSSYVTTDSDDACAGFSTINYVRNLNVNNVTLEFENTANTVSSFCGLGVNVSDTNWSNCTTRGVYQGIDLNNQAPDQAHFMNCNLSEIARARIIINDGGGMGSLRCRNVQGYENENSGGATILNGQQTVVIAHGLESTPILILLNGTSADTGALHYTAEDGTNFTINASDGVVGGDRTVVWYAALRTVMHDYIT